MDANKFAEAAEKGKVNRRRFMKKLLAAIPAIGAACMLPAGALGSVAKADQWVCITLPLWGGPDWTAYLASNCFDNNDDIVVFPPGVPLGNCNDPQEPSCWRLPVFAKWERSQDELGFVYSPSLSQKGKKEFNLAKHSLIKKINSSIVA